MRNGLKCKRKLKIFLKIFGPKKIAIFGQNLKFLAKNGHFRTPRAIFFGRPKKFFDSIIFCAHLERHFELSYAPIPQCMWTGSAKIQILVRKHHVLTQNGYFFIQKFSKGVRLIGLIKCVILRYHTTF